jgi:hypothetical protein
MQKRLIVLFWIILCGGLLAVPSQAQPQEMRRRGPGTPGLYNPHDVETVVGMVMAIDNFSLGERMPDQVRLNLMLREGTIYVLLGPPWFVHQQEPKINLKDQVEVVGSKITLAGIPTILATQVKKGDEILKLRDENGFPLWGGPKKR